MNRAQSRNAALAIIVLGAWLILSPRMDGPTQLGSVPIHYVGWPILVMGWILLLRVVRSSD